MDPQDAVDLGREALMIAMLVSAPVLVAGMVVGLVIGLLQALTQIQEQTVAFVPEARRDGAGPGVRACRGSSRGCSTTPSS